MSARWHLCGYAQTHPAAQVKITHLLCPVWVTNKTYSEEEWAGTAGHVVVSCASMLLLSLSSGCVISRVCMWAFSFLHVYTLCLCPLNAVWVLCLCRCVWLNFGFPFYCVYSCLFPTPQTCTFANRSTHCYLKRNCSTKKIQFDTEKQFQWLLFWIWIKRTSVFNICMHKCTYVEFYYKDSLAILDSFNECSAVPCVIFLRPKVTGMSEIIHVKE